MSHAYGSDGVRAVSRAARHRLNVLSRVLAAAIGGYALAAVATACLSVVLPLPRADAAFLATLLSFFVHACVVIWAFAVRSSMHVWIGITGAIAVLALVAIVTRASGAPA